MSDRFDIELDQGADFYLTVEYTDPDGEAINLTGYDCRMQVRRNSADTEEAAGTEPILDLTIGDGLTLTPSTGEIEIAITADQTLDLDGRYVYDLEIESGTGKVTRLVRGEIQVIPEVTR